MIECSTRFVMACPLVLFLAVGCEFRSSFEWMSERYDLDQASCFVGEGQSKFAFFIVEGGVKNVHLVRSGAVGSDQLRSRYMVEFNRFSDGLVPLSGPPEVRQHSTVEIGGEVFSHIASFYPLGQEALQGGVNGHLF